MKTILSVIAIFLSPLAAAEPLPSWNDSPRKAAILEFVAKATDKSSPQYIATSDRIAVFDNDGTLWCEQPMYVQVAFAIDRVKALAPNHPEWKGKPAFDAAFAGDLNALLNSGKEGLREVFLASHTGISIEEFETAVLEWLKTAKHPKFDRPYTECVYQPMLELLDYLRANGFKTFIVSGGTVDFMRPFTQKVYGIPPEQVVGSSFKTKYTFENGQSKMLIEPAIDFIDDKVGKPSGIARAIGKRPVLALGNSDGDFEMLEYTSTGTGLRLAMIVHHTDEKREYAYDKLSHFGKLDRGMKEAQSKGWHLIDIKNDWNRVFPEQGK